MKVLKLHRLVAILVTVLVFGVSLADETLYSFSLDSVDGTTVSLKCKNGCNWETVGYTGGPFFVTEDGVATLRPDADSAMMPGLILRLIDSSRALEVTCNAPKCFIGTKREIRALTHGKSTQITASPGVMFMVWKAPIPATKA